MAAQEGPPDYVEAFQRYATWQLKMRTKGPTPEGLAACANLSIAMGNLDRATQHAADLLTLDAGTEQENALARQEARDILKVIGQERMKRAAAAAKERRLGDGAMP